MSSCEKCWRDSCGDPDRYHELVDRRNADHNICTLEEQAGDGYMCKSCGRKTVHMYTNKCLNRECELFGIDKQTEQGVDDE